MYDYIIEKPPIEELYHYGVLGMKWGVRKDPAKAWNRANKELAKRRKKADVTSQKQVIKMTKKAAKIDKKLAKVSNKYMKALRGHGLFSSAEKAHELFMKKEGLSAKSAKLNANKSKAIGKAAKAQRRSSKWEESMRKAFATTDYAKNFYYTNREIDKYNKKKIKRAERLAKKAQR